MHCGLQSWDAIVYVQYQCVIVFSVSAQCVAGVINCYCLQDPVHVETALTLSLDCYDWLIDWLLLVNGREIVDMRPFKCGLYMLPSTSGLIKPLIFPTSGYQHCKACNWLQHDWESSDAQFHITLLECFQQNGSYSKDFFVTTALVPMKFVLISNCPYRGTTAVRMQWLVTNGIVLTVDQDCPYIESPYNCTKRVYCTKTLAAVTGPVSYVVSFCCLVKRGKQRAAVLPW